MTFMPTLATGLCAALIATSAAIAVSAADYADPTWPCVQRKVQELSEGLMWPEPVSEGALRPAISEPAGELIETLALRRVAMPEAEQRIAEFVTQNPDLTREDLGQVFRGVFQRIQSDRSAIIKGIERYSLKQIALAQVIDDTRATMSELMQADAPDFDTVDQLEEKLDWDERIFRDRAQSLTYVCETPVLLEKRAYAIAQTLLRHATN